MRSIVDGKIVEYYTLGAEPIGIMARIFNYGLMWEMIPCFIYLGLGTQLDFGPFIANPKMALLAFGETIGVFAMFFVALFCGFTMKEAAPIGIICGADGPTTIYITTKLAPHMVGITAVAAYSYMALVPIIQPPIVKLMTTKKERAIYMKPQMREVSKAEKIAFPLLGTAIITLLSPDSAPLIGMLLLGNLLKECGVTEQLAESAGTALLNILTIFIGLCVGCFMNAESVFQPKTLGVLGLGALGFAAATAGGVLMAKTMNLFLKEKINPILGAAGVSAMPMSARVVQKMGQEANKQNFLIMHALGPLVSSEIVTATAAGVFIGMLLR
jgi:oxaloacetate decarboxylase beta subunit